MRNLFTVLALFTLLIASCSKEPALRGSTRKVLYASANRIMLRLPEEQRVAFEVAFWSLQEKAQQEGRLDSLPAALDGKTVGEVIEMGKQDFIAKKAAGDPDYQRYPSWEAMIQRMLAERHDYRS